MTQAGFGWKLGMGGKQQHSYFMWDILGIDLQGVWFWMVQGELLLDFDVCFFNFLKILFIYF